MSSLTLYTNPMSRGRIIHWMMEELGQPYDTVWLPWGKNGHKGADYLAINPMGKVPALVHGKQVVTECAAICMYLADVFPDAGLGPKAEEKAAYYRWILFAAGPVEQAVTNRAVGCEPPAEKAGTVGYGSFEQTMTTLEAHVASSTFVCGDRFTAADVYVGSSVIWGLQFGTIPKNAAFEAYSKRLQERSAYQRSTQWNDEKVKEMQT